MVGLVAVVAVVYGLDQLTKALAVSRLVEGDAVTLVPGVLDLYLLYNPGAAFSFATGLTWVLTVVAAVVVVAVVLVARRIGSRGWAGALGLLLGGALGNLTDRLLREPGFAQGHVVDFLRLPRWPVFNFADSAVVVGAVLVVVLTFRGVGVDGTRERRGEAEDARPAPEAATRPGAQDGRHQDDRHQDDRHQDARHQDARHQDDREVPDREVPHQELRDARGEDGEGPGPGPGAGPRG